jgi:O-methyltransferase involved in polyketide biosynthesis
MVLNLAAGLDARPYRMSLPPSLKWIEVDLPEIIDYKVSLLAEERPACSLERISLDLSNVTARRDVFKRLGREAKRALVITEGLLIYLTADEVIDFGRDLAAQRSFQRWILDVASPGLLRMLQKQIGRQLDEAKAPLKFAPAEGPDFFLQAGWKPLEVRSTFKTAAKLKRLPMPLPLFSWMPESNGAQGNRPWSATCLMENARL